MTEFGHRPDPIDVEVGQHLRERRLTSGLSQTRLAGALGVSFQQIQKYERGLNRLSASMLVKAAHALGIQAADLLPPDDRATVPAGKIVALLSELRGAEELLRSYALIPGAKTRRALLIFARALAADDEGAC